MPLIRIPAFIVKSILLFDVNRIFLWRIPPMMLVGLVGWFFTSFAFQSGILSVATARVAAAASAGLFVLSLFQRLLAHRRPAAPTKT
jgi:hypothetical protein